MLHGGSTFHPVIGQGQPSLKRWAQKLWLNPRRKTFSCNTHELYLTGLFTSSLTAYFAYWFRKDITISEPKIRTQTWLIHLLEIPMNIIIMQTCLEGRRKIPSNKGTLGSRTYRRKLPLFTLSSGTRQRIQRLRGPKQIHVWFAKFEHRLFQNTGNSFVLFWTENRNMLFKFLTDLEDVVSSDECFTESSNSAIMSDIGSIHGTELKAAFILDFKTKLTSFFHCLKGTSKSRIAYEAKPELLYWAAGADPGFWSGGSVEFWPWA